MRLSFFNILLWIAYLLDDKFWIERCHILHLQIIFYCKRQKVVPSYENKLVDRFAIEIKEHMNDFFPQNVSAVKPLDQCHNLHLHELSECNLQMVTRIPIEYLKYTSFVNRDYLFSSIYCSELLIWRSLGWQILKRTVPHFAFTNHILL